MQYHQIISIINCVLRCSAPAYQLPDELSEIALVSVAFGFPDSSVMCFGVPRFLAHIIPVGRTNHANWLVKPGGSTTDIDSCRYRTWSKGGLSFTLNQMGRVCMCACVCLFQLSITFRAPLICKSLTFPVSFELAEGHLLWEDRAHVV